MSWCGLALLSALLPAALDVRVEDARGLSEPDRALLIERVVARAAAIGVTDGALVLRALALPGLLRVTLSSTTTSAPRIARAELLLDRTTWDGELDRALAELGLSPPARAPPALPGPQLGPDAPSASDVPVLGLSLLGGAVAAGAAGLVLGVMNASARDEGNPLPAGPERDSLDDRATATGLGANILFGVAGAALIAGVVTLLSD